MNEDIRAFGLSLATIGILVLGLLLVSAPMLWPLGRLWLLWVMAKGLLALFAAALAFTTAWGLYIRLTRRDPTDIHSRRFGLFVGSNVAAGAIMLGCWGAYLARHIDAAAAGTAWWQGALLYLDGLLATLVAENIAGELFQGTLYRSINMLVSYTAFILAALWLHLA
ncbi:MAG: hypothetical protein NW223_18255 [Hyphomicrobiaceae bacterium]|nr:hypothetical protein [Hyphomicrobiaceae bacterium]